MVKSKSIKIYFNARFLTQSVSGVQRYAIELLKALDKAITNKAISVDELSLHLISPKNTKFDLNLKHIPLKTVGSLKGHLWEQIELPYYVKDGILVSLCNTGPLLTENQILTIHDMAEFSIPMNFSFQFRKSYQLLHKLLSKRVKKIITVSLFSKNEIIKYCGVSQEKIEVIYESGDHMNDVAQDNLIIQKYNLFKKPYILAVSSVNPNKNFASIIKATEFLEDLDFNIVIAGKKSQIFNQSSNLFLDRATYVGFVADSELKALYKNAACFVFPSFYEGFGIPPLEAMTCECPVIVSKAAALPEVCRDSVLYCDPKNPEELAMQIKKILDSKDIENDLRRKGLNHVKNFTWIICAKETFKAIRQVTG